MFTSPPRGARGRRRGVAAPRPRALPQRGGSSRWRGGKEMWY